MARPHPTSASNHRPTMPSSSSHIFLHAAWIAAVVAVYLTLCTIHSRKPASSRRRASRSASSSNRHGSRPESSSGGTAAAGATPAAKVSSSTPLGDTATANGAVVEADDSCSSPVTVIEVGTHGPIAPAFLPPPLPDPVPPRRSLSLSLSGKHIRGSLGRIRSMQRGGWSGEGSAAGAAAEDDVFVGHRGGGEVGEEGTLWTKTIILGERCCVPAAGEEDDGGGKGMVPWKSYRARQPRSVPVTRSNSFAGVGSAGARRLADPRF